MLIHGLTAAGDVVPIAVDELGSPLSVSSLSSPEPQLLLRALLIVLEDALSSPSATQQAVIDDLTAAIT